MTFRNNKSSVWWIVGTRMKNQYNITDNEFIPKLMYLETMRIPDCSLLYGDHFA